jgi:hypothetical protein
MLPLDFKEKGEDDKVGKVEIKCPTCQNDISLTRSQPSPEKPHKIWLGGLFKNFALI